MDPLSIGMAAGQTISNIAGMIGRKKRAERQYKHDKEMAQFAYDKDLEMWQRQNEYNHPSQQMARLKEAGLNPRMIYGSGSAAATGQAGTMPKYQQVRANYDYEPVGSAFAQGINAYQDLRIKKEQADNLQAQTNLTNERREHETFKTFLTNYQGLSEKLRYTQQAEFEKYFKEWADRKNEQSKAELAKTLAQTRGIDKSTLLAGSRIDLTDQMTELKKLDIDYAKWMKDSKILGTVAPLIMRMLGR